LGESLNPGLDLGGVLDILGQRFRYLFDGKDVIDQPGVDGASHHAIVLGVPGVLSHGHAAVGLDFLEPQGAVGAGAGKEDANGPVLLLFGQRPEEMIDGHPYTFLKDRIAEV
jgi:hypothetical protein